MTEPLLDIRALHVAYGGSAPVLRGVDLTVARGSCVALLGASGSGKSTLGRMLLDILPHRAEIDGEIRFAAERWSRERARQWRGRRIALVLQDAAASLHPMRRIGAQVQEALDRAGGARPVADALAEVGLDPSPEFAARYPHQVSGGQRQRVMIAMALAASPELLVADEITASLDPLVAAEVLDVLRMLQRQRGLALLFISHDVHAVRRIADRVVLLRDGRVDCAQSAADFFASPATDAARAWCAADAPDDRPAPTDAPPNVHVHGVSARHGDRTVLRDIDFSVPRGSALGIVGASGSGKSTLARVLLALHRAHTGDIAIAGEHPDRLGRAARKAWRRRVQIVFQDPGTALDPRMTVAQSLTEPLRLHRLGSPDEWPTRVDALLDAVQLDRALATRLPHALSGGQQQRVAIARALALSPDVLVCDEAVSALDRVVQRGIIALLRDLQRQRGLTLLFISHDLDAVRSLCDRVLVLERGRVVEQGETRVVFADPQHAHTRALLDAYR